MPAWPRLLLTICLPAAVAVAGAQPGPWAGGGGALGLTRVIAELVPAKVAAPELESWRLAAQRGVPGAQTMLASMYYLGAGMPADPEAARAWYRKAAEQGDTKAQTIMGLMSEEAGDAREAARWFRLAAEQGEAGAQSRLGQQCYLGGELAEARLWLGKAAAQGDASSQARLGAMCYLGQGAPRDNAEALKWLRLASAQGDPGAQGSLGLMYALGDGVPRDNVEACAWLLKAGAGGNEQAGRTAQLLMAGLTPAQIEQAKAR
jgi:hypothetical protein